MTKNANTKRKFGRDEEISPDELLRRYAAIKRFLEDNWARIGLELVRVCKPDAVRTALNRVPNAKWCIPFRDFPMGRLLEDGSTKVDWRDVRETRAQFEDADAEMQRLSLEFQNTDQLSQSVTRAYEAAVAQSKSEDTPATSRRRLKAMAKDLKLEEVTNEAKALGVAFRDAQQRRQSLWDRLSAEEAWLARNEIVEFVRDPEQRYAKTPMHFAMAMAGLPVYDWLYSIRKCISIPSTDTVPTSPLFQVFELLKEIVKRTKSADMNDLRSRLRKRLLKEDPDSHLRSFIGPFWYYMERAFDDCRGKKSRLAHVPYRVIERYLYHFERQSSAESEIAKRRQLG